MIIPKEIKLKYDHWQPYIERLGELVDQTLFPYCQEYHFAYTSRCKTIESVSEKIETGRFSSWESLDDFFAATIIIPNLNMEEDVIAYLASIFEQVQLRERGSTKKAPDVFKFSSTRFIARYKPLRGAEEILINKINFEVQVRSAFEHAWSIATHSLVYKTDEIDWKILRLSAQLKSSVEQLDMLISGYHDIYPHITEHQWPLMNCKIELLQFIKGKIEEGNIPREVVPNDLSRFCDNVIDFVTSCNKKRDLIHGRLLTRIFENITKEFDSYATTAFPRSVSLFQVIMGIMVRHVNLIPAPERYSAFITPELEIFFPEVKQLNNSFQFE